MVKAYDNGTTELYAAHPNSFEEVHQFFADFIERQEVPRTHTGWIQV
ncbi:MAG: hypothetical protein FWD99_06985 [Oscillospiraceae bacterium]|nr:hypothetical protein [Oscillospiraceae bacterium]